MTIYKRSLISQRGIVVGSAGPCGTGGAQEATPRNQGPKETGGREL